MTDRDALWAGVLMAPADAEPKLVLADWLAERETDPDLERGLRWCAANGKWPKEWGDDPSKDGTRWVWLYSMSARRADNGDLIDPVWDAVYALTGNSRRPGIYAAKPITLVRRLGRALADMEAPC